jgi:hypothetical protein
MPAGSAFDMESGIIVVAAVFVTRPIMTSDYSI